MGLVGEFVRQPGQSAFGEFQHPALREYHPTLLAATVRTTRDDLEERPLTVALVPNPLIAKDCP
jgi:hypothetical protein